MVNVVIREGKYVLLELEDEDMKERMIDEFMDSAKMLWQEYLSADNEVNKRQKE